LVWRADDERTCLYRQTDLTFYCRSLSLEIDDKVAIIILFKKDIIQARIMHPHGRVTVLNGYDLDSLWFESKVIACVHGLDKNMLTQVSNISVYAPM